MTEADLCLGCMRARKSGEFCEDCGWEHGSFPKSPLHLAPGTVLRDQYLLGRVLGYGGFGVTYLAWDLNLTTRLAVKEYLPSGIASRTAGLPDVTPYSGEARQHFDLGLEKFLEEARLLARFKDVPNIVSVLNFFRANGTAYMVMEYLEGRTLEQHLREHGGKLPVDESIGYIVPVVLALSRVHREAILHRDISPDNVYITTSGLVKLLDFGAARFALGQQSKNFSVILKEGYSPEEQYRSKGVQGPWTDVYAVAATLYRCITGVVPPAALDRLDTDELVPPRGLGGPISESTEKTILKALAVRMQDRYQSVEDFRDALLANPAVAEAARTRAITALPRPAISPDTPKTAQAAPAASAPAQSNMKLTYGAAAAAVLGVVSFVATRDREPDILDRPMIREFRANPERVPRGGQTTLFWSTANTDKVTIEPNVGVQSGGGKIDVPVRGDTNFILTVHDKDGNMVQRMNAQVYVDKGNTQTARQEDAQRQTEDQRKYSKPTITPSPGPDRGQRLNPSAQLAILEFNVTPQTVAPGQQVLVRWNTAGASDVTINGTRVGANGASSVQILNNSSFALVARAPSGTMQQRVAEVVVRGDNDVEQREEQNVKIAQFEFDPPMVSPGQQTTLRWSVTGVNSVVISPDIGRVAARGAVPVQPRRTSQYTIQAGNDIDRAMVIVSPSRGQQQASIPEAEDRSARQQATSGDHAAPGRSFQVMHDHGGIAGAVSGLAGRFGGRRRDLPQGGSCSGTLTVQAGLVRYSAGEHGFTQRVSELGEVKRNRLDTIREPSFHIKLRSGDNYNFTPRGASVDEVIQAITNAGR